MKSKFKPLFYIVVNLLLLGLSGCEKTTGILSPKGIVTGEERQLLFDSTALMSIIVLTVIIMSIAFVYHYRESNKSADIEYKPEWCHSVFLEVLWWGIPAGVIIVLSIMTWRTTHTLDPFRRLNYPGKVMNVQVVALPWKWLFIYPEQNIATVNQLTIPKGKQVEFHLTSDNVPMSSFIVPQLGSQIYTMAGMRTRLHLVATDSGELEGLNTQYNGDGFASMKFKVNVTATEEEFNNWVAQVKGSASSLTTANYNQLRQNSISNKPAFYSQAPIGLFNNIIKSYNSETHPTWGDGVVAHAK